MVIQFPPAQRFQGRAWFAVKTAGFITVTLAHGRIWQHLDVNDAELLAGGAEYYWQLFAGLGSVSRRHETPRINTVPNQPLH